MTNRQVNVPTVSVVIPAYNESRIIESCLRALLAQSHPADEIIVVDNNSTDDTVALARAFPGVTVITEPRQGITYARTAGFDAATGDIIARIDADTVVSPGWVGKIRSEFLEHPEIDALAGNAAVHELSPGHRYWATWVYRLFRRWHEKSIGVSPMMYGYNCALRTRAWHGIRNIVNFDDQIISEDVDVTISLLKSGSTIRFSPDLIVKCHVLRTINFSKLKRYYNTDSATLALHSFGNSSRWAPNP